MHCGYVVKVTELRKHTNADRLQVATFFGHDTIVDLSVKVGDVGVYFPVDLQLSEEYTTINNLVKKKDEAGNNIGGFLDPDKRNIQAIRLRGEKSDGLYMPLRSFAYCWNVTEDMLFDCHDLMNYVSIGDKITNLNGHEICCKYVPKTTVKQGHVNAGNKTRSHKVPTAPLFKEHADTEQLAYNLGAFKSGDLVEITLKMHGTSQRTAYLPVLKGHKKTFWQKLFRKEGTPVYDWDYVSGTRRVVLDDYSGGFYGSNEFREQHSRVFEGKLWKGETVYYEVVGFTHTGAPIMASANNDKLQDKEFIKQYGKETVFSYGCDYRTREEQAGFLAEDMGCGLVDYESCVKPQSDIYVYRMTMTNEDGEVVEYNPDFMRYRCEQMGVKTVPVFWRGFIPSDGHDYPSEGEWIKSKAEAFYDGPDPIGKTHIREGVVVRIINRPKFAAYKHKNFSFQVLSGIAKNTVDTSEMSEDIAAEL